MFFSSLFTQQPLRPKFRVAFLLPQISPPFERSVNKAISDITDRLKEESIIFDQYADMDISEHACDYAISEIAKGQYDLLIAISMVPAQVAYQIEQRIGFTIPTISVESSEYAAKSQPSHVYQIKIPAQTYMATNVVKELLTKEPSDLIICADRQYLKRSEKIAYMKHQLSSLANTIRIIPVDNYRNVEASLKSALSYKSVLFNNVDPAAAKMAGSIIDIAHQHETIVIASDLNSINYGADIIVGFDVNAIGEAIARKAFLLFSGKEPLKSNFVSDAGITHINVESKQYSKISQVLSLLCKASPRVNLALKSREDSTNNKLN